MMGMRHSDATFLRREIVPILQRTAQISPDAESALGQLCERLAESMKPDEPTYGIDLFLRAERYEVLVEGSLVPYIDAHKTESGRWCLSLDGRFSTEDVDEPEMRRWLWFIAHAMAVAAGRTSHGENSYVRNPHGRSGAGDPPVFMPT